MTANFEDRTISLPVSPRVHDDETRAAAYEIYRTMPEPSVAKVSDILGIPLKTMQKWATSERWVERRKADTVVRVATMRETADAILYGEVVKLMRRLVDLAYQDEKLDVAARCTIHALALFGLSPVSKQAIVTQRVADATPQGGETRDAGEIAASLHERLALLSNGSSLASTPPPPGHYDEEREDEDGRGPRGPSATPSEGSEGEETPSEAVIETAFREPRGSATNEG